MLPRWLGHWFADTSWSYGLRADAATCLLLAEVTILQREWEGDIRLALPPTSAFSGSHCETTAARLIARTCKPGSPASEGRLKPQESGFILKFLLSCPLLTFSQQIEQPFRNLPSTSVYE